MKNIGLPQVVQNPRLASVSLYQPSEHCGDDPVQAYISAVPGWMRDVTHRLDVLISGAVPHVHKAVQWNLPMVGVKGQGWFASMHVFTKYVKVTLFKGTSLNPVPPGGTAKEARWIDVREGDLDEAQLVQWAQQAAAIAGWGKSQGHRSNTFAIASSRTNFNCLGVQFRNPA